MESSAWPGTIQTGAKTVPRPGTVRKLVRAARRALGAARAKVSPLVNGKR